MQQKIWKLNEPVSADLLNQFPQLPPLVVQMLSNRGITSPAEVEAFLNPDFNLHTHDPFLFKDMEKCVARIYSAIERGERIIVHGDYDSDGVNGSAVLVGTLLDLGAVAECYLPHREKDGYGINPKIIPYLLEREAKLMITVDCGSTNHEAIAAAEAAGINVIITDHHHAPEVFPPAFAVLNPQKRDDNYPFKYLAGTGVAFKLAQALFLTDQKSAAPKLASGYDKWLLDLVSIGTITDMMPLLDENRALVKYGLIVMNKTRRPGLKKLLEHTGIWSYGQKPITPFDIGFVVGPRINAAGRMDHANSAYLLMMAKDEKEAEPYVENIEINNRDRKALTEKIIEEVMAQATDIDDKYVLVAYGKGWPVGVAGLIASKVLDKVSKPVIIMTQLEDRIAASGRSVPGFDMAVALEKLKEFFSTSGGHAMACGFSLNEGVDPMFIKAQLEALAQEALEGKDLRPTVNIEAELEPLQVRWDLIDTMESLKPFGMKNPEPIFLTKDLTVAEIRNLGESGQHLKLKLQDSASLKSFSAIGFNHSVRYNELKVGDRIDIIYRLDVNEWNGNRELQLKIEDINIL